ncbi:MAG TPA: Omp28 family outer membrane lipoprotein [Flavobacteriales bacterium]|nr:Omp28 family outer membrane lipoprotein [Flavobacteriales bacterium]
MTNKRHNSFWLLAIALLWLSVSCDKVEPPFKESTVTGGGPIDTTSAAVRRVLVEDFTGHTCGNCPRAAETAQSLKGLYGDQLVVIAEHIGFFAETKSNPDSSYSYDFTTTAGNEIDGYYNIDALGLPKGMVNRTEVNGTHILSHAGWGTAVQALLDLPPDIEIKITNTYDAGTRVVTSTIETEFLNSLPGTYNVVVYLTEDSIINWQKDYQATPSTDIENYVHRHVLRGSLNGTWGDLVDPAPVISTIYTKSYDLTLDNTWDENHCSIVAFVYETTSKEVVQAEEAHVK